MFELKQIGKKIFQLSFENPYDLAMHFLRATEYFECPNPDFHKKNFEILEFMDWYTHKERDTAFNYQNDWDGFNLSYDQLDIIYGTGKDLIPDLNMYDERMDALHTFLSEMSDFKYYLIGAKSKDKSTIKHEIAHALYYLDEEYRVGVQCCLANLEGEHLEEFEEIKKHLIYLGYVDEEEILLDEMQAYMATDSKFHISVGFSKEILKECTKEITKLFKESCKKNVY